jgi:PAS domain S-box-containing protein
MGFSLAEFHQRNSSFILRQWAEKLHQEVGEQYASRPIQELMGTVSEAFEANHHVLVCDNFRYINEFIDKITKMRLEAGFLLSDVQKAFELYRIIVIPLLAKEAAIDEFQENVDKINQCLAYTIHRFSDHFQDMHEKGILEHNQRLEEEVKARTAELRESELKYKTLVEEINEGYFVIQDEVIVFANKTFCEMHGYPLGEVIGRKFYDFVDPESRQKVVDIYARSILGQSAPASFEYLRVSKEGRSYPTEITAKVARYERKVSSIGLCRDISKRVEMDQRIREAEKMAYIGQITTSLSHEIRNPLSAVKMNLQIINRNAQLRGNDQRRIDISIREVIRLDRILTELLDFAKPLQVEFAHCRINSILNSCLELLEMKFMEKALSRVTSYGSGIPDITGDSEKLGQAFINLLLNAIEASPEEGSIHVTTLYHSNGRKPQVEVLIEDQGPGISQESLSEIFKPFFTTKSKGTGLGLSNTRRILEVHGGRVEVENRAPRYLCGACFHVFIPAGGTHGQNSHSG